MTTSAMSIPTTRLETAMRPIIPIRRDIMKPYVQMLSAVCEHVRPADVAVKRQRGEPAILGLTDPARIDVAATRDADGAPRAEVFDHMVVTPARSD